MNEKSTVREEFEKQIKRLIDLYTTDKLGHASTRHLIMTALDTLLEKIAVEVENTTAEGEDIYAPLIRSYRSK